MQRESRVLSLTRSDLGSGHTGLHLGLGLDVGLYFNLDLFGGLDPDVHLGLAGLRLDLGLVKPCPC